VNARRVEIVERLASDVHYKEIARDVAGARCPVTPGTANLTTCPTYLYGQSTSSPVRGRSG